MLPTNGNSNNGNGGDGKVADPLQELDVLRKVARAAEIYRDTVIAKRSLQMSRDLPLSEVRRAMLDIGSAEFELSDALTLWARLNRHFASLSSNT